MIGIKYINRIFPNTKFADWEKSEKCSLFIKGLKMYIFNDLFSVLVHTAIMILLGIVTNFNLNDNAYDVVMSFIIYAGIVPIVATLSIYLIGGLIVYPITKLIEFLKK